ncbi:MAG TPA: N-acetylmuramoyl-L-alanine amidase [Coriobacteriia bacterium]|nr:N-acetylmuramoyl-L-alanine amidase [Coriobacteriia bacterium]
MLLLTALVTAVALLFGIHACTRPRVSTDTGARSMALTTTAPAVSLDESHPIEVPRVIGSSVEEARVVLEAAGLTVSVADGSDDQSVLGQDPAPGSIAAQGDTISLVTGARKTLKPSKKRITRRYVVCIDPGHQEHGDTSSEPIGPGAKESKAKVTGGTTGVSTGLPEYEVVLQISNNLRKRLAAKNVKVVMTRTTNDVDLSNSERAAIANKADADLFIRIHCDGNPKSTMSGISTLYPAANRWTESFAGTSKKAARALQSSVVASTGAVDLGIVRRGDLSGFNYSQVPSVLVECGFMSNSVEDRLLASPHYQDKIAEGLAEGTLRWLDSQRE